MKGNVKVRNSKIELLRIVAMLFIVLSHSSVHGMLAGSQSELAVNTIALKWFVLGNLGVDIYILISGYFLCEKKDSWKSMGRLLGQVWFYSILGLGIYTYACEHWGEQMSVSDIIYACFPTVCIEYWFFTVYIILLLLVPFINIALNAITQKQFQALIGIMLVWWSIIPSVTTWNMYGNEVLQFIMLYCIGAYFKKFPATVFERGVTRHMVTIVSWVALLAVPLLVMKYGDAFPTIRNYELLLYGRNSVIIIGCAVGMFAIAVYSKPYANKLINLVGGCTFGVYLLHDNPLVRRIIWKFGFPNYEYLNSYSLIPRMLVSVVVIFLAGVIVDYLRKLIFEKVMTKMGDGFLKLIHLKF